MNMTREEFIQEVSDRVFLLIEHIGDEYRSTGQESDDHTPSMDFTVGCDGRNWAYQTGDNRFHGAAYGYADWATTVLTRESDPTKVAEDLARQFDQDADFEWGAQS
jgi:hypothetical protein